MKGYPARNFNQSYGIVKSLIGGISSSTYRDNAKRRSRFQQQPVKTKAVEGKSVKIDYRVEDGISAIESLKFPPVEVMSQVKSSDANPRLITSNVGSIDRRIGMFQK
ncbi:hypothetical protein Tco_0777793 [Tanacetum coccineum]